ncbi:hypothetical protein BDQ17DRAFT_1365716 [Cyathus striatus]|nr:hypothetical protein BDQ17DRAFT_1365716 [Cyathus striatus]
MQMDKITTSTKSVADYFKEKLLSKSSSRSGYSTPTLSVVKECEVDYVPRGGLGSSRVRFEVQEMTEVDTKRTGLGLPKFSCLMSSSLPAAASSITAEPVSDIRQSLSEESILIPARNSLEDDESDRIAKKKETKERKEKRKEKKKEKEGEIVKDKREEEKKERRPKIKDGESRSKKSKVDVKNGDEELESRRSSPRDTEKTSAAANEKAERRRQKQEKKEKRAQKRNSEVSE